ncbi:unnamed protein product [Caenorhabditis angaria]|uniref:G-protein coupled receptors family 1 profile domain-containing protein n=1 Tax=Caenorhabditis angaria TaxID=860376 RepID=A0A9P1J254_9PELO|nr:unnamed protein product [Caenorhabditis angaria]
MTTVEEYLMLGYRIYYYFYLGTSITLQLFLLFIIINTKTKLLVEMRIYLINTLILQMIICSMATCLQSRIVPNRNTVSLLCLGPCRYYGAQFCQHIFELLQTAHIACATSLILAFYYRYKLLKIGSVKKTTRYLHFSISYIVPLLALGCSQLAPSDLDVVKDEVIKLHPTYNVEQYAIIGYSGIYTAGGILNQVMYALAVYASPIIAIVYRRKILNLLNTSQASKLERIDQSKSMIRGLTIQTLIPIVAYIPILTFYGIATYADFNSIIIEFIISPTTIIYTMTDPILTIYYVLPYRRVVKRLFSKPKTGSRRFSLFHSETNTVFTVPHT